MGILFSFREGEAVIELINNGVMNFSEGEIIYLSPTKKRTMSVG